MALAIQYDLFEPTDDISLLKKEIEALELSQQAVRRGLFARHNQLAELVMSQHKQIEELNKRLNQFVGQKNEK